MTTAGWTRTAGQLDPLAEATVSFDGDIGPGVYLAGDLTGDNEADWWVAETEHPYYDSVVYLVAGPVSGLVDAAAVAVATIHETVGNSDALFRIEPHPGDLTGDGSEDLLFVGSDNDGWVVSSPPVNGVSMIDTLAVATLTGMPRGQRDLTGDGIADLIHVDPNAGLGGEVDRVPGPFSGDVDLASSGDLGFVSDTPDGGIGVTVIVDDFDGDGDDDWLLDGYMGEPRLHSVAIFFAPAPGLYVFESADTTFGTSDSGINRPLADDFDGDGHLDLVVDHSESVLVVYGPFPRGPVEADLTAATELYSTAHSAEIARASLDLDDDGLPELLANGQTEDVSGVVWLLWGPLDALGVADLDVDADVTLFGAPLDMLGDDIHPIDDTNGDCIEELVISATAIGVGGATHVLPNTALFGP